MIIYVFFFLLLLLTGGLSYNKINTNTVIFIAVVFTLIIGLRGPDVGPDTPTYIMTFQQRFNNSLSQLFIDKTDDARHEYLYVTIMWAVRSITDNYTIMLLVWAILPVYLIWKTQKDELEYSPDLSISYIVFFILGFFVFYTSGIRQTVAISIAFFSYRYLKEPFGEIVLKDKNSIQFMLCMILGYYIHNSILVFAIIYPLKGFLQKIQAKAWHLIPVAALFFVGKSIGIGQITAVAAYLFDDTYSQYGTAKTDSLNSSAFIMQMILYLMCFFVRDRLFAKDKSNILLLNLVFIGMVAQSMSGALAEMARISYYFSIFYIVLIPRALQEWTNYGKNMSIYVGFVCFCLFYLFFLSSFNMPDYSFFWNK